MEVVAPPKSSVIALVLGALLLICCKPARAAFHLWKFQEIYSNADGTVQFVELVSPTPSSGEQAVVGKTITSAAIPRNPAFALPTSLPCVNPCNTSGKTFLVATPGFAALPGAVTPDFTFPSVNFFSRVADTIRFSGSADTFTFTAGQLPTTGFLSRVDSNPFNADTTQDFVNVPNSPRNWAGQTGSLFLAGDLDSDGDVDRGDAARFVASLGMSTGATRAHGDSNGDGRLGLIDVFNLQKNLTPVISHSVVVPEPSSLTLLTIGLVGVLIWKWTRCHQLITAVR